MFAHDIICIMKSFIREKLAILIFTAIIIGIFVLYRFGLPAIISSQTFVNFVQKQTEKALNAEVIIQKPTLKTGIEIGFTVDKFEINKNNKKILSLSGIDTLFSIRPIFRRQIEVKKLLSESIFVDVDDLISVLPKQKEKKQRSKSFFKLDLYNVLLGVKKCEINYNSPQFDIDFKAKHMIFDRTQKRKFLHFDFDFDMKKDSHKISVAADDMNKFYMEDGKAYIVNFPIAIDKSKVIINAEMDRKNNYKVNFSSKNFSAADIADIINSNIFIANGRQMLEPICNINGKVDFSITLTNKHTNGEIKIDDVNFNVIQLLNMPVKVKKGTVNIGDRNIEFINFEGFYNNNPKNKLTLKGETKDYQKTCDTKILSDIFVTNDFFKNYLSKMLGSSVELVGNANSKLILKSKNGSLDVLWFFLLKENQGFKFGEQSMVLKDYKTLFKADLSVIKNILKINTINYYISNELKRGMTPLIQIDGNLDMEQNMKIIDLNVNMPRPLPSEFLNFIACQKIFKKGMVSGKISINNHGIYPVMTGEFNLDKVLIPAQRMFVKSAKLIAKGDRIALKSDGRFRRANYDFDGYVLNKLEFPIIVKDVNLTVDNIDVEKILTQPQTQTGETSAQNAFVSKGVENEESLEPPDFVKNVIIVEKCGLNLKKGVYKEINFGNLQANMTLDKNGILNLKSNRFDIADGISTLRVKADLSEKNYYLRLGLKDVDSNIMASAILGLPRQISGKAKGLIELNTDKTLKLNGDIKFRIADGTIEQVGYVEYILKVASLFRNPLAMISPSMVVDLVNIPEGRFDDIYGEMKLKDNIIQWMKIESSAPELATFIIGRYDLTTNDAMLRVYTKFSDKGKGFAGTLRNISLNSLASKISISSRNESNYYANELSMIPKLKTGEERAQVFLTKVDGDILNLNFLSSLKRIK